MDTLIFLGTLVAVLLGGFLVIKLLLRKKSSGRNARYQSVPVDGRLKQRHTGRPYLRHQTSMRKDVSDEIWKASRQKADETSWQNASFTANKISTDAEKEQDNRKQREGFAMPSVDYAPSEPTVRPASSGAAKRGLQSR